MVRRDGSAEQVNRLIFCILLLAASCRDKGPPTPTAEQSAKLDNAEDMLNDMARNEPAPSNAAPETASRNEEGPEHGPGPSN
jgi:hypothetical protein